MPHDFAQQPVWRLLLHCADNRYLAIKVIKHRLILRHYLFGLNENIIHVYDLESGTHIGSIDMLSLDSTTKIFKRMHISRDALKMSVLDSHNAIFVVEIDKFFQPLVKEEPIEDEYFESESEEEGKDILHFF